MGREYRIALCGGGTGGHVMPALNIFRELKTRNLQLKFWYIGNRNSLEEKIAISERIEFLPVRITYLKRHFSLRNMVLPFIAAFSVMQALIHLLKNRIDIVIGTGGFSAWPALAASSLVNIPYVLQEQNTLPGLVTRLTVKKAQRIYLGHERAIKHLNVRSDRVLITGNPLSWAFDPISVVDARRKLGLDTERPTIFITGGSGGAASMNLLINSMKSDLIGNGFNIIWQTGKHWDNLLSTEATESENIFSNRFFSQESMFHAYSAANIAIVRCGEMTLAELALAGLPAILVPFPFSSEGHQEANGLAVEADGAGVVIRDSDLTKEKVAYTIKSMMEPATYASMKEAMLGRKRPDAVTLIVDDILEVLA